MRLSVFTITFTIIFCLPIESIFGQSEKSNVVVMNFYKFQFPDEVSVPEFDSLAYLYQKIVLEKNELIVSHKILRHWWGNRDREFVILYEVNSWDDVILANQRNNELFEEHLDTKEKRDEFNQAFYKYFEAKFPDEVYKEVIYESYSESSE
jgi:hypothetical protein